MKHLNSRITHLIVGVIACSFLSFNQAQAQTVKFFWIGAGTTNNWTDAGNWNTDPCGCGISGVPDTDTEVAEFIGSYTCPPPPSGCTTNPNINYNKDALINYNHLNTNSGKIVAGLLINGYTGTITQGDNARFIVAESYGGPWSQDPDHRAIFNFGAGGKFVGANVTTLPNLDYSLAFYVPVEITGGEFHAPKGRTHVRYSLRIDESTADFYHRDGRWLMQMRSGTSAAVFPEHKWDVQDVVFGTLQVSSFVDNRKKNFSNTSFVVENLLETYGAGSQPLRFNDCEIHCHGDIKLMNQHTGYTSGYWNPDTYGNGTIYIDAPTNIDQHVDHTTYNGDLTGPLPNLVINKAAGGDVLISGNLPVQHTCTFIDGIIRVNPSSTAATNRLCFNVPGKALGTNDDSYMDGAVLKRGKGDFEFPTGKNNHSNPLTMNFQQGSRSSVKIVEYFPQPTATFGTALDADVTEVSDCEYWEIINQTDGNATFTVQPSYDNTNCEAWLSAPESCNVLSVATWDDNNSYWTSLGTNPSLVQPFNNGDNAVMSDLPYFGVNDYTLNNGTNDYAVFTFAYSDTACTDCDNSGLEAEYTGTNSNGTVTVTDLSGGPVIYIQWLWGDGSAPQYGVQGETVSHSYAVSGTYDVCVVASTFLPNNICCYDTFCTQFTVIADACSGYTAMSTATMTSPNTYTFEDVTPGSNVSRWTFPDGTQLIGTGFGSTVSYSFPNNSPQTVEFITINHLNDSICCIDTTYIQTGGGPGGGGPGSPFMILNAKPNPVKDVLHVQVDNIVDGRGQLSVKTFTGQTVKSYSSLTNGTHDISVATMPPGIYVLELVSDGEVKQVKFVKQ